MKDKIQGA